MFFGLLKGNIFGDALSVGMSINRLHHIGVIKQPLNHIMAPGQFERFNRTVQTRVQSSDHTLHSAPEIPPHRGDQCPLQSGNRSENRRDHHKPNRKLNCLEHSANLPEMADMRQMAKLPRCSELTE